MIFQIYWRLSVIFFLFFDHFSKVNNSDFIIICVPTPLKKDKAPDLSYIKSAVSKIKPYIKKGNLNELVRIVKNTKAPQEVIDNRKFAEELFDSFVEKILKSSDDGAIVE